MLARRFNYMNQVFTDERSDRDARRQSHARRDANVTAGWDGPETQAAHLPRLRSWFRAKTRFIAASTTPHGRQLSH